MTYQDPDPRYRNIDPNRDIDPRLDPLDRQSGGSGATWGWIAGIVVLVLMLVFLFGTGNENVRTSNLDNGASAPMTNPAPVNPTSNTPPAQTSPGTTGQGQQ